MPTRNGTIKIRSKFSSDYATMPQSATDANEKTTTHSFTRPRHKKSIIFQPPAIACTKGTQLKEMCRLLAAFIKSGTTIETSRASSTLEGAESPATNRKSVFFEESAEREHNWRHNRRQAVHSSSFPAGVASALQIPSLVRRVSSLTLTETRASGNTSSA